MTADDKPKTTAQGKSGTAGAKRGAKAGRGSDQHISNALRSAYEEAVRENVPSEFLDLLGKLS